MVVVVVVVTTSSVVSSVVSSLHGPKNSDMLLKISSVGHNTKLIFHDTFTNMRTKPNAHFSTRTPLIATFVFRISFYGPRRRTHGRRAEVPKARNAAGLPQYCCSCRRGRLHWGGGQCCSCSKSHWKTEITAANKKHQPKHFTCVRVLLVGRSSREC